MLSSIDPDRLLTEKEAAKILRISVSTLRAWRNGKGPKKGPKVVHIGRKVFYRVKDIIEYIERNTK